MLDYFFSLSLPARFCRFEPWSLLSLADLISSPVLTCFEGPHHHPLCARFRLSDFRLRQPCLRHNCAKPWTSPANPHHSSHPPTLSICDCAFLPVALLLKVITALPSQHQIFLLDIWSRCPHVSILYIRITGK